MHIFKASFKHLKDMHVVWAYSELTFIAKVNICIEARV